MPFKSTGTRPSCEKGYSKTYNVFRCYVNKLCTICGRNLAVNEQTTNNFVAVLSTVLIRLPNARTSFSPPLASVALRGLTKHGYSHGMMPRSTSLCRLANSNSGEAAEY